MQKPLYCCADYIVDSDGYVLNKNRTNALKSTTNNKGYQLITISTENGNKTLTVHSAVAKTFLGDMSQCGMQINHIDGDKTNNALSNLEWVTQSENIKHSIYITHTRESKNKLATFGFDKKTGELLYAYDSLAECVSDIKGDSDEKTVRTAICKVIYGKKKSYRGCIWTHNSA